MFCLRITVRLSTFARQGNRTGPKHPPHSMGLIQIRRQLAFLNASTALLPPIPNELLNAACKAGKERAAPGT